MAHKGQGSVAEGSYSYVERESAKDQGQQVVEEREKKWEKGQVAMWDWIKEKKEACRNQNSSGEAYKEEEEERKAEAGNIL